MVIIFLHLCLSRFFKVYDSDDRQPLLEVYHDQVGNHPL